MLEKSMYDSWASRIRLFIKGKKHVRMMLDSINNGPLVYPNVKENRQIRPKKYSELTKEQKLQDDYDVQAKNIILHDLSPDVYAFVNHQEAAKAVWDNSKFVTDVKLTKSLYTTTYDQLYAYLSQHKRHANAERIMRKRYPDPLALVAASQTLYNPSQSPQHSVPTMHPPPQQFTPVYAAPIHHQQHHNSVNPQHYSISPQPYLSPLVTQQSQAEFPQVKSGLAVPVFQQGESPIDCINKVLSFMSVVASRFPPSNNQLITSSNAQNQATIQDGRVIVQQVQGRQI
uniref:Integrase, catalytic region, zinc finger, CCHC-type, peptidase aspartic, catalytic n=1 Tax=Tanacetum cinerariifolium TaxID=118510 RepID=A0A6L2K0A9_TANCI|nr:hypothetical protein [Tanacetum cinerariifolium]